MNLHARFVALPPAFVDRVRRERRDDWGNQDLAPVRVASERSAPCRACMRDARPGEEVLLFSYSPFPDPAPYRAVGPVFVHAHARDCASHAAGFAVPEVLRPRLLALRAYDERLAMIACDVVEGERLESVLVPMLADPRARAVHVHYARAGCFACVIERA
jgi:hypothetical protein